jgi:hypothetical protein
VLQVSGVELMLLFSDCGCHGKANAEDALLLANQMRGVGGACLGRDLCGTRWRARNLVRPQKEGCELLFTSFQSRARCMAVCASCA